MPVTVDELRELAGFDSLPAKAAAVLAEAGRLRSFSAKESLFLEGDTAAYAVNTKMIAPLGTRYDAPAGPVVPQLARVVIRNAAINARATYATLGTRRCPSMTERSPRTRRSLRPRAA